MNKTFAVCDHCGGVKDGPLSEVVHVPVTSSEEDVRLELCGLCRIAFDKHVRQFITVRTISATAHFIDNRSKVLE